MSKIILLTVFLSGCSSFYYYPHSKVYTTPNKFKLFYKETTISSASASKLKVWLIKKEQKTKSTYLISQFHGNAENMSTHFSSLAWLTKHSFDLLTFDYSGYGKSTGKPSPKTLRRDALAFLNHTLKIYKEGGYSKLIIYGQSLGGAVVMDALNLWDERKHIDLLVLDSTFTSYKRMGKNVLQKSWITYLLSPLAYVILNNETAPENRLNKLTMPKLVIHSNKDHVVNFSEGKKLFKSLPEQKYFWEIHSPGHVSVFFVEKNNFRQEFVNFVKSIK